MSYSKIPTNRALKLLERLGVVSYIVDRPNEKGWQAKCCSLPLHKTIYDSLRTVVEGGGGSRYDITYNGKFLGVNSKGQTIVKDAYELLKNKEVLEKTGVVDILKSTEGDCKIDCKDLPKKVSPEDAYRALKSFAGTLGDKSDISFTGNIIKVSPRARAVISRNL